MSAVFRRVFDSARAFLTPHRCRLCGRALFDHANPYLCRECLAGMEWIGEGACRGCGYPAGPSAVHREDCFRCRGGKLGLTGAAMVARYRGGTKEVIKSLKFRGETTLAGMIAELMTARWRESEFYGKADFILPVALHKKRKRWRGFDQALLLSKAISERSGLPVREGILLRIKETPPQAMLRRAERLKNLEGAFQAKGDLKGAKIVLVDDVMTTGATMAECARVCRAAGAARIYALTFAR